MLTAWLIVEVFLWSILVPSKQTTTLCAGNAMCQLVFVFPQLLLLLLPIVLLVDNHICTSTIVHHVKPFLEGNYKNVILLEWTQVTKCLPPSARPFCCAVYFWLQNLPIVLPTWATSLVAVGTGSLAAETLCKLPTLAFLYEIILLLE